MKFIAQWGIYAYTGVITENETRYQREPFDFEKDGKDLNACIRAAKAHVTKLVKADENMQELREDKWGYGPYPPKWDAWSETANTLQYPDLLFSFRTSQTEYERDGNPNSPTTSIYAKIWLYWKEQPA